MKTCRLNLHRVLTAIALLLAAFVPVSCGGGTHLPEGWVSHVYKLIEHPDAFTGTKGQFEEINNYITLNTDTRRAFRMWDNSDLSFDVNLPVDGKIKFAYGFGEDLSGYQPEVSLEVKASDGENIKDLDSVKIGTTSPEQISGWTDVAIPIPLDATGQQRLSFTLSGFDAGRPWQSFFLAHPSIVAPTIGAQPKRIILISVDTLRADHIGCYGYNRPTTPNIDAFAQEATLFENCLTPGAWTFPAYAAMFTGKYPSITGATTNMQSLPVSERTLADIISASDFATFSVVNVSWPGAPSGLNRGFDSSKLFWDQYADVSLDYAREWLKRHAEDDVFMFIHLFDPHQPYFPKDKFFGTFDPGYEGRYKRKSAGLEFVTAGEGKLTEAERKHLVALYDEDILGCDESIGNFLQFLKDGNFYEDSLIIINADHGEEFGEHGKYEHGHQLYTESIRVPTIIRGPGFTAGERIKGLCGNFDIFPTILEWLKIEVPGDLNAVSLNELINGRAEEGKRWLLTEQLLTGVEQKAVSTDVYRYIYHTLDGKEELYDITDDPVELSNIADQRNATSRNYRYLVKEYALNQGIGWHVRIVRGKPEWHGEPFYEGRIVAPSGFAEVKRTRIGDNDKFEQVGNELTFHISVGSYNYKAFDFTTNDENDQVQFEISSPNNPRPGDFVFIGPELIPMPDSSFSLSILDPLFGLGMPQFLQSPGHDGLHIWGTSAALHEEVTPDLDNETIEELKSLGYLN